MKMSAEIHATRNLLAVYNITASLQSPSLAARTTPCIVSVYVNVITTGHGSKQTGGSVRTACLLVIYSGEEAFHSPTPFPVPLLVYSFTVAIGEGLSHPYLICNIHKNTFSLVFQGQI